MKYFRSSMWILFRVFLYNKFFKSIYVNFLLMRMTNDNDNNNTNDHNNINANIVQCSRE